MNLKNNIKCPQCNCENLRGMFQNQASKFKYNPIKFKYKEIKFKYKEIKGQCPNCKKIYYITK